MSSLVPRPSPAPSSHRRATNPSTATVSQRVRKVSVLTTLAATNGISDVA